MRPVARRLLNGTSIGIVPGHPTVVHVEAPRLPLATVRLMRDGKFVTPAVKVRAPWRKP